MMVIDNKYELGQIVYLKTDKDQMARQITGILAFPGGVRYQVACGSAEGWYYDIELAEIKDILITSNS